MSLSVLLSFMSDFEPSLDVHIQSVDLFTANCAVETSSNIDLLDFVVLSLSAVSKGELSWLQPVQFEV